MKSAYLAARRHEGLDELLVVNHRLLALTQPVLLEVSLSLVNLSQRFPLELVDREWHERFHQLQIDHAEAGVGDLEVFERFLKNRMDRVQVGIEELARVGHAHIPRKAESTGREIGLGSKIQNTY